MRWSTSPNTFSRVALEAVREYRMPNVRLFVEAAHQAYGAEMTEPPKRHGPRPLGLGRVLFSHGFRVKDAADEGLLAAAKPALVDLIDGPRRRSELPSTLSQLKQWKVRMGESDWGELADISVIGA